MIDWYAFALAIAINYSQLMMLLQYLWILTKSCRL